jgi:hypothetical protein
MTGSPKPLSWKGQAALALSMVKSHDTLHKPVVPLALTLYVGALIWNNTTHEHIQSSVTIEMAQTFFFLTVTNDATRRRQLYNFLAFKLAYIGHVTFELVYIRKGIGIINRFTLRNLKTYIA